MALLPSEVPEFFIEEPPLPAPMLPFWRRAVNFVAPAARKAFNVGKKVAGFIWSPINHFVFGDVWAEDHDALLKERAAANQGVGIVRLGPKYLGRYLGQYLRKNYVYISTDGESKTSEQRLKAFMNLAGKDARSPYHFIDFIAETPAVFGVNTEAFRPLRQKFAHYLMVYTQHLREEGPAEFKELFDKILSQDQNAIDHPTLIQNHLHQSFGKLIFGILLSPEIISMIQNITVNSFNAGDRARFIDHLQDVLWQNLPGIRMKLHTHQGLLMPILRDKYQDLILSKTCTKEDLRRVALDRDVRAAFVFLSGVKNIGIVIIEAFASLQRKPLAQKILEEEQAEDKDNRQRAGSVWEIFYNHLLHVTTPTPKLLRYTKKATQIADVHIPANSTIIFSLDSSNPRPSPSDIVDDQGALTAAALRKRTLLEFGLGSRQCPGVHVSKQLVKLYVMKFIECDFKTWNPRERVMPVYSVQRQLKIRNCDVEIYINVALRDGEMNIPCLEEISGIVRNIFGNGVKLLKINDQYRSHEEMVTRQLQVQLKIDDPASLNTLSNLLAQAAREKRAYQRKLYSITEPEIGNCMTLTGATPDFRLRMKSDPRLFNQPQEIKIYNKEISVKNYYSINNS